MAALGWLMNLGFAASGAVTYYGVHVEDLTVIRSGVADMNIDSAGHARTAISRSGIADAFVIPSGATRGLRVRRSGSADIVTEG